MDRYRILLEKKFPYSKPELTVKPWVQDPIQTVEDDGSFIVNSNGDGWSVIENVGIGVFNPRGIARVTVVS